MSLTRRSFLASVATAGGAALASPSAFAAPFQVSVQREASFAVRRGVPNPASSGELPGAPLALPATMPMGSGAPLGGIGTGFIELRPDGCFYEWQIFNAGPWAQNARSTTAPPAPGPQYLRFVLRTQAAATAVPQVRRLYLRSDESDTYTLPFVQDVDSIEYEAWYPMTGLRYNDPSIPVRVSASAFSPFIAGNARDSATPGFHMVFTLENTSKESVDVSLAGFLDNPLASALPERRLNNTLAERNGITSVLLNTHAETDFPSGIGNMCLSVTGGAHSYITGTFQEYALPGNVRWETPRVNYMLLSILQDFLISGRLPNTGGGKDPSLDLPTDAEIAAFSPSEIRSRLKQLSDDALLARVFSDARSAQPGDDAVSERELLKEVAANLRVAPERPRLNWGTAALASSVHLAPGGKTEIRFTLSWFFPHHLAADGHAMGHMYSNWFQDSGEVNRFLCENYDAHRAVTERFAGTLADTSLGDAMAFAWSSQLSTLVFNTWWVKDGSYAIWEGLGCCGLSTTDVDFQGSFPVVALFPELKLNQMRRLIALQNERGQVPHTYSGRFDKIDVPGFGRVDMNPQFVMMVYRDYLWTADREYLAFMWPYVLKAMAFTGSLDTNSDGLPDRDTGFQTYDQWRMRGTPSYIASLWIGALRAASLIATELGKPGDSARWTAELAKAATSFDSMLFNGEYYSLWADGTTRDELCMTDQISGEWFTHLIGLPSSISRQNLAQSIDSIVKYNFNSEFGLHNATAPKRGAGLLALTNLQAGGLWSGIEFAFASFLMDHGRYDDGVRVVEAIHRRYLRAGQPWNHVECGGHYSRAMSSWATLLAATGFKPDLPNRTLTIAPAAPGDLHAPWVMPSGFGTINRSGQGLSVRCAHGNVDFKTLHLNQPARTARLAGISLDAVATTTGGTTTLEFGNPVSLTAGQTLEIL